jgi:hypothetical protein
MPMRMGRPGLVGTMARTAVIAGTATATANAVNSRAQSKAAAQQPEPSQQAPAAPAAGGPDDLTAQLTQLKALVDQGILTQDEFDAKKKQLLGI